MPKFRPTKLVQPKEEVALSSNPSPGSAVMDKIRQKLGHLTLDWAPEFWLDTGDGDLNEVLGHRTKGIPYGRIAEISGLESQGKTAICLTLAGLAQASDAGVIWVDLESSYDASWAAKRGLKDDGSFILIQPYVGTFGKEKTPRLSSVEELCEQAEAALKVLQRKHKHFVLVVDSIASMLTKSEAGAGLTGNNMRTKMDLPMFLSTLLRRWVGLAQSTNTMVIMVNQLRQNPMARFEDPWYTPGGNAVRFYCHIRARVRRVKGGILRQKGKQIGIQGTITNNKNKAGGTEKHKVGYKLFFKGGLKFVPADSLVKEED